MGVLNSSGVFEINGLNEPYRGTLSLTSSAPNRKIELSINGGVNYFTPQYDVDLAEIIGVAVFSPVTNIRFVGVEGDTWRSLV